PEHETQSHLMVRKTLQDERFYLVYQPIVSLAEDKQQRYEVLLRILDEEGEVVLPSQFLEVAESMGLSGEVDIWVIENAFKKLAELQRGDKDATFYIKVSGKTIADRELALWIDTKMNDYQLQRENVVIEIAEEAVLNDMENSMAFVTAMHNLNCKVALEHYGASSPPQVLKRLPVDVLKVNGGLIAGMAGSEENQVTVKTIITLARDLGMECVAEQVEDTVVLALLWQYGVQLVQGNFVQIPSRNLDYNFEASVTGNESSVFSA
ncbi:MAG: EAL domain-containing protein, partial [Gammaproteobacteria bacterium]|nr:EAL domain-containing protein [Gammaproteobacteria bacterium]